MSLGLDTNTLSRKSASFYSAGTDGQFGTTDDARIYTRVGYKKGLLTLRADTAVGQRYRIKLNAAVIKDIAGRFIDGEFQGKGLRSGNGVAGGNYDIVSNAAAKTVARISTSAGYMSLRLFGKDTPITAANFLHYANEGAWDNTFFHRSIPGFVVQAGGFNVNASNQLGQVHSESAIQNEPGISNTRGTIAMARAVDGNEGTTTDRNSATNQWFLNLSNSNATNLDNQEGGFAVFGTLTDSASLRVMDAIAGYARVDASSIHSAFNDLPVKDAAALQSRQLNPTADLILVQRVAMLMDPSATPNVQAQAAGSGVITKTGPGVAIPQLAPVFSVATKAISSDDELLG
jgi:cyclophilin family peptidyl-prolyl cis-trans isomerase